MYVKENHDNTHVKMECMCVGSYLNLKNKLFCFTTWNT